MPSQWFAGYTMLYECAVEHDLEWRETYMALLATRYEVRILGVVVWQKRLALSAYPISSRVYGDAWKEMNRVRDALCRPTFIA